jgi:hypothetical protein
MVYGTPEKSLLITIAVAPTAHNTWRPVRQGILAFTVPTISNGGTYMMLDPVPDGRGPEAMSFGGSAMRTTAVDRDLVSIARIRALPSRPLQVDCPPFFAPAAAMPVDT